MSETGTYYELSERTSGEGRKDRARSRALLSRHRNLLRLSLMLGAVVADIATIAMSGILGGFIRYGDLSPSDWDRTLALLAPSFLLAAIALRAYNVRTLRSFSRSILRVLAALVIAAAISFSATFAMKVSAELSRLEVGYTLLLAALLLALMRAVGVNMIRKLFFSVVEPRIVVLTDGVGMERRTGNMMTMMVNVRKHNIVPALSDPMFFDRVSRTVRDADRVVLAFSEADERLKWAEAMRLSGLDAEIIADLGDVQPLAISHWQNHTTLVISRGPMKLGERLLKRAFDLAVTSAMLLIVGPVIAVCAVLVKLDSPGPAFFVQERVGRNNRTYRCFKLRSMRTDLLDTTGSVSASRSDPRVTRIGNFLRRTSLDELPQLFNVLNGDMSLVGPRPHALGSRAEGALFWELIPDYWSRHTMKPGVTGLAQVRGYRGATHSRVDIERRVAADLEYINGWSLWLDIKILIMTIKVAVHHNAY
ncbi:exopolysaccharide biosynthesis polyprenyl glycosylphosphotransferase [Ancylobacter sp. SL191]|uniref:exopolysaccharide biosynthesis polyprenyl glycosylphosphotransferase n=1 Tax=Ancylobacter sp. SL191 TaxID=2995166 RepID=UPI0022713505|nr:exopolysaccharide biosynthesis polyprenyl glycosylphosphotransferase [Ancylobacter sp. SL191]WAC26712.1 exopolysaccharide biosynthesis polyprenyl glycosylphosphotransferase [Ancylobacter sp. SL191]